MIDGTYFDREDESRQSEAEGVWVDKAVEGPDDVVLGGLRADVQSGVLTHCRSSRLSREPIIPLLQGNRLTRLTYRIHPQPNCGVQAAGKVCKNSNVTVSGDFHRKPMSQTEMTAWVLAVGLTPQFPNGLQNRS